MLRMMTLDDAGALLTYALDLKVARYVMRDIYADSKDLHVSCAPWPRSSHLRS